MNPIKIGGLPAIWEGGQFRVLGCLQPSPKHLGAAQRYGDAYPVVKELEERDYAFHGSPIRNQGQYGSCASHAGTTALDIVLRMIGAPPPLLSATMPYALVNGGRDNGSVMSDVLNVLIRVGTCLNKTFPESKIYKSQLPRSAYAEAANYKITQAYMCRSYEELCSAIHLGFPVSLGIMVGQNFGQLDSEGVCPLPDRILGGHALCGMGLKKSARTGEWLIKFQNSWTAQWGQGGFAYLRKAHFGQIMDGYAVVYPKSLNDPPPVKLTKAENKKETIHGTE